MFVMEHYYDRVPLFVFPEIYIKIQELVPENYFTHTELAWMYNYLYYIFCSKMGFA